jgi:hypothetical protein
LPAFAIGHAERDEAAGPQARAYFGQKFIALGLVFQHFEKCHHIEDFIGVLRPESLQWRSEDAGGRGDSSSQPDSEPKWLALS